MSEISTGDTENGSKGRRDVQRVWLVRHGLTQWNTQQRLCGQHDIPLSNTGKAQARWLASQLRDMPVTTVYTSDLGRARETAKLIASRRTAPVEVISSAAWREVAFGAWEGLTYAEIAVAFKDSLSFFADPELSAPPGGESLTDVLQRAQAALAEILHHISFSSTSDVVIVSHGGTLRGLLCTLLGMPLNRQWQLRLDPGSLSAVDLSRGDNGSLVTTLALLNSQRPPHIRRGVARVASDRPMRVDAVLTQQEMEPIRDA